LLTYPGKDDITFAILLRRKDSLRVLRGIGVFTRDGSEGEVVRVRIDTEDGGNIEIIIQQDQWPTLLPGAEYDCDFAIQLTAN
jgi:hypothetical protein